MIFVLVALLFCTSDFILHSYSLIRLRHVDKMHVADWKVKVVDSRSHSFSIYILFFCLIVDFGHLTFE